MSSPEGHAAIRIRGARTHNLKNIDLDLPRDRLTVITGPSGSGKSSLAFDTLYAEGQRRYVESLSAYARQFLSVMEKPDVDHIEGLSPAISIEQKSTSHNPRSTVGTITEIYDYLRLLFDRVGEPQCPEHGVVLRAQTVSQMVDALLALPDEPRVMLLAPVVSGRKGEHAQLLEGLRGRGYVRARIDGELVELDQAPSLDGKRKHDIEVVVDRLRLRPDAQGRLADSVEAALNLGDGLLKVAFLDEPRPDLLFSARFACPHCGYSVAELEPRLFSFNNPAGACPECDGLGVAQFFDPQRIVANPRQSLAAGAIPGWDRRNAYYMHLLDGLARHYGFDVETPFEDLAQLHRQVLLYGSGDEVITFTYSTADGRSKRRRHPFEGIVNNFARRYRETDSNAVREHLARFLGNRPCTACGGSRLRLEARHVFVAGRNLPELVELPVGQAQSFFAGLDLPGARGTIAQKILREIEARLGFLVNVGLDYLTLARSADTLSGGEAQRIRLASQIGAGLVGVLYVLDEPSIGLHQRDNQRLLSTLTYLRDLGNTVIVIEHDEDAMRLADHLVDIGPGAGIHGGYVIAEGTPAQVAANPASVTGQYLAGKRAIAVPQQRATLDPERVLRIDGASGNNLKDVTVDIPLGLLTCVTGVSGSGKSTLINETLYKAVAQKLNQARDEPAPCRALHGLDQIDKIVNIDQSPIGRTPRSNPATYTGLFTPIRELMAATPEARARAYGPGRFSFNVAGGRCEACQGDGMLKVEMHFLADIYVPCDVCHGQRYNRETLEIQYKGRNIHQILDMTVEQAGEFFSAVPIIKRKLDTLAAVGLGYIRLGQAATTLSGGEAQRVKLSRELSKRDTGRTLYILDEPTTGLHFQDIELLLGVLTRLRDEGNTLVVIEHNLDVIKTADWVIDLGPEGGGGGGEIIACGTPEQLAREPASHTGRFLAPLLIRDGKPVRGRRSA
jgi:excinuclease ABC subunit A